MRQVTGVEINEAIVGLLNGKYKNFTHLAADKRVHLVNEDARSYLSATKEKYDFIQLSLVDTFATTASGALTFNENSIYTVDAWKLCLSNLPDQGIFSISYRYSQEGPVLFHRMV